MARGTRERVLAARLCAFFVGVALVAALVALALHAAKPTDHTVLIRADGMERQIVSSRAASVAELLAEAGVVIGSQDLVSPPLSSPLTSVTAVTVVRVQVREETQRVPLSFERVTTPDPRQPLGYRRITQKGVPGILERREQAVLHDGAEVERKLLEERIVQPPVPEVVVVGQRADPALDAFRQTTLSYLGRGGVTRLSAGVVEQAVFELARLQGNRYGTIRVLSRNERCWLVISTFGRTTDEATLLVFWWGDETHAFSQILGEGLALLDVRAEQTADAVELGLVVSPTRGNDTQSPHYLLYRLPFSPLSDTWSCLWSSMEERLWRSSQGMVVFRGQGLELLHVRGASSTSEDSVSAPFVECRGCPRRHFDSIWQRQGDAYTLVSQQVIPSPFTSLWDFVSALQGGRMTEAATLATTMDVVSSALRFGLGRPDLRWTATYQETETTFTLRAKGASTRATLSQRDGRWLVSAIGPLSAAGRVLYTGTRPVVRGLFSAFTSVPEPALPLGEGERYVWSPSYSHIAYDWQGIVYIMDAEGSNVRTIGPGRAPAWSPDGASLAFERAVQGGTVVVTVDLDTGREIVLAAGGQPSWAITRDGQRVAFAHRASAASVSAVYVIDIASGASSLLASDGAAPLWSPTGDAVAFLTSQQDIVVLTFSPHRVTTVGKGWGYTWSVDGQRLAFIGTKPAGRLFVWYRQSEETKPLLDSDNVDGLSWSPDGKEIVLSLSGGGGLWLVQSDGSNLRKLADGRDPMWAWPPRSGR